MERKYYETNEYVCYQEERKGFFKHTPAKFYEMLLYEENGKFFELLTGKFLGTSREGKSWGYHYIFSSEFGETFCLASTTFASKRARSIPPGFFADKAKKYMEDKNDIIPHLNKEFEHWRLRYSKELEKEKLAHESEREVKNWLDNLLDNRK